jgi:hypothetical protein
LNFTKVIKVKDIKLVNPDSPYRGIIIIDDKDDEIKLNKSVFDQKVKILS